MFNCKLKYRYLVYRLYEWASKIDSTPVMTVAVTLACVHFFQMLSILILFEDILPSYFIKESSSLDRTTFLLLFLLWFSGHYLWIKNVSWKELINEFGYEKKAISKMRGKLVLIYLIGSMASLFVIAIVKV